MEEDNKALVRRYIEEVLNEGNVEAIDELVAQDFIQHGPGAFIIQGAEAFKAFFLFVNALRESFPVSPSPNSLIVDDVLAEGNLVAVRVIGPAIRIRKEDMLPIDATAAPAFSGVTILQGTFRTNLSMFRIESGKIAEVWEESNSALMRTETVISPNWELEVPEPNPEDFVSLLQEDPTDPEAMGKLLGTMVPQIAKDRKLQEVKKERVASDFGDRYETLYSAVYEELLRIDPFKTQYSSRGQERDYHRKYRRDVIDILDAIDNEPPTSTRELRRQIFRTLKDNPYGNRWGHVGNEGRYADMAARIWKVLHPNP